MCANGLSQFLSQFVELYVFFIFFVYTYCSNDTD